MPVLCDFTQIVGNTPVNIGDGLPVWEKQFLTGGRRPDETALLIFNVRGLTYANVDVDVKINNQKIGQIALYGGKNQGENSWYTQMIAMAGSTLNNGGNEIQIEAVGYEGATNNDKFDNFELKDVICFFHQAA